MSESIGSLTGFLKPCYVFSPGTFLRRILLSISPTGGHIRFVELPWGGSLVVSLTDSIGREIFKQRIFDIAVSELAWRLLRHGDQVIDAGANIGYMTSLFAARLGATGKIDSFEPHPKVRKMLEVNVAACGLSPDAPSIVVHACALSDRNGHAHLIESDYFAINQGTAHLTEDSEELVKINDGRSYAVDVRTLDEFFDNRIISLLKVDVEGFEAKVLKGSERLLQEQRIAHIIYEDHTRGQGGLPQWLTAFGYSVFSIGYNLFGPLLNPYDHPATIDPRWESASYLATLQPDAVRTVTHSRGWWVLSGKAYL